MFAISDAKGGYKKVTIIHDASLTVGETEIVALLGRNGVGKSTLMKYAMGLIDNFGGSVSINGKTLPSVYFEKSKNGVGLCSTGTVRVP